MIQNNMKPIGKIILTLIALVVVAYVVFYVLNKPATAPTIDVNIASQFDPAIKELCESTGGRYNECESCGPEEECAFCHACSCPRTTAWDADLGCAVIVR